MEKIPTMYRRDETLRGHPVIPGIKPECAWVEAGEGVATRKLDGTNVKISDGKLFKRCKPKDRDYDNASYIECCRTNPADKWLFEAFDISVIGARGIYECIGPKIQGNPENSPIHVMIGVSPVEDSLILDGRLYHKPGRTFDEIRDYLEVTPIEGIVFHHPDGRMAKIKRRDFGLPWPVAMGPIIGKLK